MKSSEDVLGLDDKMPEPFASAAWVGFINFALGKDEILRRFEKDTGEQPYSPPKTGLEALIDKATGYDKHRLKYLRNYIVWVTENLWGEKPEEYFLMLEKMGMDLGEEASICTHQDFEGCPDVPGAE